ncbi:AI-2E family transporter, partial [Candidatus Dojkabacteria bacterium]|nr:AI-2E family transporter [Candidatus Dojkabacteria bacterium]
LAAVFSVLGGLSMFGFLGILYGPMLLVVFLSFAEIYNKNFLKTDGHEIST